MKSRQKRAIFTKLTYALPYILIVLATLFYYFCTPTYGLLNSDVGEGALTFYYKNYIDFTHGHLSFWNPYVWSGVPSVGQPVFQLLYPIYYLIYAICFITGIGFKLFVPLVFVIHTDILVFGCIYFINNEGIEIKYAVSATVIVLFCSEMLAQSHWLYLFTGFVWYPYIVTFFMKLCSEQKKTEKWRNIIWAGTLLGISGLANQGQTLLQNILMIVILYVVAIIYHNKLNYALNTGISFVLAGLLGFCLCSPALLPTFVFTKNCARYIPEMGWVNAGDPISLEAFLSYGSSLSGMSSFIQYPAGLGQYEPYWISHEFPVVGSMLTLVYLTNHKERSVGRNFCIATGVFCLMYSINFIIPYIFYYIPGYNAIRESFLYIPYLVLSLSYFVAKSLIQYMQNPRILLDNKRTLVAVTLTITGILLPSNFHRTALVLLALFLVLIPLNRSNNKLNNVWLVMLVVMQLLVSYKYIDKNYTYDNVIDRIDETVVTNDRLVSDSGIGKAERIFGFGVQPWSNNSMTLSDTPDALGYLNPVARSGMLLSTLPLEKQIALKNIGCFITTQDHSDWYHEFLNINGVYIGTCSARTYDADETSSYEMYRMKPLGTAWVVNSVTRTKNLDDLSNDEVTALLSDGNFDPSSSAYINADVAVEEGDNSWSIDELQYGSDDILMQVSTEKASVLVTSENWYPGWSVAIDGKESELLQVDCVNRGCLVPAGVHTVHFFYRPIGFKTGCVLAVLSVVIYIVIFTRVKMREA